MDKTHPLQLCVLFTQRRQGHSRSNTSIYIHGFIQHLVLESPSTQVQGHILFIMKIVHKKAQLKT